MIELGGDAVHGFLHGRLLFRKCGRCVPGRIAQGLLLSAQGADGLSRPGLGIAQRRQACDNSRRPGNGQPPGGGRRGEIQKFLGLLSSQNHLSQVAGGDFRRCGSDLVGTHGCGKAGGHADDLRPVPQRPLGDLLQRGEKRTPDILADPPDGLIRTLEQFHAQFLHVSDDGLHHLAGLRQGCRPGIVGLVGPDHLSVGALILGGSGLVQAGQRAGDQSLALLLIGAGRQGLVEFILRNTGPVQGVRQGAGDLPNLGRFVGGLRQSLNGQGVAEGGEHAGENVPGPGGQVPGVIREFGQVIGRLNGLVTLAQHAYQLVIGVRRLLGTVAVVGEGDVQLGHIGAVLTGSLRSRCQGGYSCGSRCGHHLQALVGHIVRLFLELVQVLGGHAGALRQFLSALLGSFCPLAQVLQGIVRILGGVLVVLQGVFRGRDLTLQGPVCLRGDGIVELLPHAPGLLPQGLELLGDLLHPGGGRHILVRVNAEILLGLLLLDLHLAQGLRDLVDLRLDGGNGLGVGVPVLDALEGSRLCAAQFPELLGRGLDESGQHLLLLAQQLCIGGIQLQQFVDLRQFTGQALALGFHIFQGFAQLGGIAADLDGKTPYQLVGHNYTSLLPNCSRSAARSGFVWVRRQALARYSRPSSDCSRR